MLKPGRRIRKRSVLLWTCLGLVVVLIAVLLVVLLRRHHVTASQPTEQSGQSGLANMFVSPAGTGNECTSAKPCALIDALDHARPGGAVHLMSGDYGALKLRLKDPTTRQGDNVVVSPADGADVKIASLETYVPRVTWHGITVLGVFYLRPLAAGAVLDGVTVNGAGLFERADDVVIKNSLFENGSSLDGIQIGGGHRVLIESNVIRDYNQNGTTGYHADCIQMFDSADITVVRNRLSNCYNAGIILSRGAGKGLSNVLVESNFIQGCVVVSSSCRGAGSTVDMRESTARDVTVRNNTMLSGSARVGPIAGLIFDRNVIYYLSSCDTPMTNTIVAQWNKGLCKSPEGIGKNGNRIGDVAVKDLPGGDLHPLDPASVTIQPAPGDTTATPLSIDGTPLPDDIAGAAY